MASGVFNVSKGGVNELVYRVNNNDPAASGIIVVLLKDVELDSVLRDYDDLAAILAAAGNTECDFTNYARKTLTDTDLVDPTVDDTNDWRQSDMPDQTWNNAGGALNNDIKKLITAYAPDTAGADSTLIPATFHDVVYTTRGIPVTVEIDGFFRAA